MILKKSATAALSVLSFAAAVVCMFLWAAPLPALFLFLCSVILAYITGRRSWTSVSTNTDLERFGLAVTGAQAGVWDWRVDIDQGFYNDRYYKMAGYEPGEYPPSSLEWEKRLHPDDLAEAKAETEKCIRGEVDLYTADFRFHNKSGEYRWIRGTGKVVEYNKDGSPRRFIGTHSDIHDLKTMENQLRHYSEMLQHVIDYIPQFIFWKDLELVYRGCNRSFAESAGLTGPEMIVGKTDFDLPWTKEEAESYRVIDRRVMDSNNPELHYQETQKRADGREMLIETNKIPLHDNKGLVAGILGTFEDVTEKKRIEEMLVQNEKMLSVGGLAAGMAHEINSPLAGMIQTAEVLRNRLESGEEIPANAKAAQSTGISLDFLKDYMELRGVPRMLESIQKSGSRISEIVDNMLSFARMPDSCYSSKSMNAILDKTIELASTDFDLKKGWDFKNIEIVRDYDPDLPLIPCEAVKIQQVFFNIIKNGAQAMFETQTESPRIIMKTGLSTDRTLAVLEISNNGPLIEETVRRRVFEPFFTTKPAGEGTGLGLSVSYFIITKNHGGEMEVVSDADTGVTFIIRLPIR